MRTLTHRLIKNERGATAIEYVLLAGLISVASISAMNSVGTEISGAFTTVKDKLDAASTQIANPNTKPPTQQVATAQTRTVSRPPAQSRTTKRTDVLMRSLPLPGKRLPVAQNSNVRRPTVLLRNSRLPGARR